MPPPPSPPPHSNNVFKALRRKCALCTRLQPHRKHVSIAIGNDATWEPRVKLIICNYPTGGGSIGGKTHLFSCLYFFSTVGWWRRRMKVHFWVDMSAERPSCVSKGVREEGWDWTWDFGDNFCLDSFSRETFPLGQHGLGWHEKRHNSCRSEVKLNKRFFSCSWKIGYKLSEIIKHVTSVQVEHLKILILLIWVKNILLLYWFLNWKSKKNLVNCNHEFGGREFQENYHHLCLHDDWRVDAQRGSISCAGSIHVETGKFQCWRQEISRLCNLAFFFF